jgi:hypothetical protein
MRARTRSRAAFAVFYYEQRDEEGNPIGDVFALKDLLNHARLETTEVYLRRRNKARAKEVCPWPLVDFRVTASYVVAPSGVRTRCSEQGFCALGGVGASTGDRTQLHVSSRERPCGIDVGG